MKNKRKDQKRRAIVAMLKSSDAAGEYGVPQSIMTVEQTRERLKLAMEQKAESVKAKMDALRKDDGPGVGYGTNAPSTPVEYPDMPETRAAWLQSEAARREAAYFDEHPDERPKGGLVNVSTLLKAWFPVK